MARARGKQAGGRKPNRGSFAQGYEPRRHVFTAAERKRGYAHAFAGGGKCADVRVAAWVWRKVRGYYRARERGAAPPPSS